MRLDHHLGIRLCPGTIWATPFYELQVISHRRDFLILAALSVGSSQAKKGTASTKEASSIPVIYTTDLFHPHDDPDDHFDLAAIFTMPEVDLNAGEGEVREIVCHHASSALIRAAPLYLQRLGFRTPVAAAHRRRGPLYRSVFSYFREFSCILLRQGLRENPR